MSNSQLEPMVPITIVREVPVESMMAGKITLGQIVDFLTAYVGERAIVDPYSTQITVAHDYVRNVVGVQMVVMGRHRPEPVVTEAVTQNGPALAESIIGNSDEMAQLQSGPALAD